MGRKPSGPDAVYEMAAMYYRVIAENFPCFLAEALILPMPSTVGRCFEAGTLVLRLPSTESRCFVAEASLLSVISVICADFQRFAAQTRQVFCNLRGLSAFPRSKHDIFAIQADIRQIHADFDHAASGGLKPCCSGTQMYHTCCKPPRDHRKPGFCGRGVDFVVSISAMMH